MGRGGVGGGRGGSGMSKGIGRALTRFRLHRGTVLPTFSSDAPNFILKHKSSTTAATCCSSSDNKTIPFLHHVFDMHEHDSEWVSVDSSQGVVCGVNPPSKNEVEDAVLTIQQLFGDPFPRLRDRQDNEQGHITKPGSDRQDNEQGYNSNPCSVDHVSAVGSEIDWTEPSFSPYNSISNTLQVNGYDRVYYALHLLQTDPSVQRIVRSLSTDEAVWDAVLNNEVVQELRELISAGEENVSQSFDGNGISDSDSLNAADSNVVIWILSTAKSKFIETIEQITKIVTNLFQRAFNKTSVDAGEIYLFNEKLRASFMISIMVMLIVMVTRLHCYGSR
ncbi:uncharacterized protein LOC130747950 [Lotus japonicus]|uniref:uncharacterized protein LOC130747950 n=1 Tax=Lotus japonicus TaxID=34305 RepID=UPI00258455AF|nr:uncharacterized protein LOC130747950 [Lotus japonicus]